MFTPTDYIIDTAEKIIATLSPERLAHLALNYEKLRRNDPQCTLCIVFLHHPTAATTEQLEEAAFFARYIAIQNYADEAEMYRTSYLINPILTGNPWQKRAYLQEFYNRLATNPHYTGTEPDQWLTNAKSLLNYPKELELLLERTMEELTLYDN